jgi:hypothetical protein
MPQVVELGVESRVVERRRIKLVAEHDDRTPISGERFGEIASGSEDAFDGGGLEGGESRSQTSAGSGLEDVAGDELVGLGVATIDEESGEAGHVVVEE